MLKLNSINKKRFSLRRLWILRYRVYSCLTILIIIPLLYSSGANLPQSVEATGYNVVDENMLAQRIERIKRTAIVRRNSSTASSISEPRLDPNGVPIVNIGDIPALSSSSSSSSAPTELEVDTTGQELTSTLKAIGINAGYISTQRLKDANIPIPIKEKKETFKIADVPVKPLSLNEVIPIPESAERNNFFRFQNYNINAPIVDTTFDDLFGKNPDGTTNFTDFRDTSDVNSPLQKKLQDGIVHLVFTPQPGELGNSYIVGHSSNFSFIKSSYNTIFKPIERKGTPGEEFIIYDTYGRELKFRVFETEDIEEGDIGEAYKPYPDRRVVTLQTSIVSYRPSKGLYPYERWLVRGELICSDGNPCTR